MMIKRHEGHPKNNVNIAVNFESMIWNLRSDDQWPCCGVFDLNNGG